MALLDTTSFAASLKTKYDQPRVNKLAYMNNPFLGMVKKSENFDGANRVIALRYGSPQGRSATFTSAQANKQPGSYEKFTITRAKEYCLASIDGETIEASMSSAGALLDAAKSEIEGAIHTSSRAIAINMYRSGNGARGAVGAIAGTLVTLATIEDISNFEFQMVVRVYSSDFAINRGVASVTALDRGLGTLTASGGWPAGTIATDQLVQDGDRSGSAGLVLQGWLAWNPTTAPGPAAFFGVDRTKDITRLSGQRITGGGAPIEEVLIELAMRIGREGGRPDHCFIHHSDYSNLIKALGAKAIFDLAKSTDGIVGYKGVKVIGPTGDIMVVPDQNAPKGNLYMCQLDTWTLHSLKPMPRILEYDGNRVLREASADAYELRVGGYGQLGNDAPGWVGVATL